MQTSCSQRDVTFIGPYQKSFDFDLSAYSTMPAASITISNQGTGSILLPAVFLEGDSALNRSSVLSSIQSAGALPDEEFALATWEFVTHHTVHYCYAGAPGDANDFALEPMRLLHGFGFACCDESSRILNWLWQAAGYPTRVAQMTFHTVPEIFYKGAWHMYDADHKVYYLEEDNRTVASVATVIANPSLVARTEDKNGNDPAGFPAKLMASLYATATPYYYSIDYKTAQTYSLQPGQSFTLQSKNSTTGIFHGGSGDPLDSTAVSSGVFDWGLDFSQPNWYSLSSAQQGVSTSTSGANVFLTNTGADTGFITYFLSSPFPVFTLRVTGLVYLADSGAAVNAYFSTDGSNWSTAFPLNGKVGGLVRTTADLSNAAQGQYSYYVKIELLGNEAHAAQIASPHITAVVQDSLFMFPKLVPGQVNHVTYQDWSPRADTRNVNVSLNLQ
jgi:hypothetical protein